MRGTAAHRDACYPEVRGGHKHGADRRHATVAERPHRVDWNGGTCEGRQPIVEALTATKSPRLRRQRGG